MTKEWSLRRKGHAAALHAVLAEYRVDTLDKACVRLAPPAIGIAIFANCFRDEFANHWGKAVAFAIAYIIVVPIFYIWKLRTFREESDPISVGLSPHYTAAGRKQFKAGQRAKDNEIASLAANSRQLEMAMGKLDLTTDAGQQEYKRLAPEKLNIDQRLAELEREPKLRLGYMAGD